jgi:hypothetical protein
MLAVWWWVCSDFFLFARKLTNMLRFSSTAMGAGTGTVSFSHETSSW